MFNLAIFASGSGTNAENIIRYFENHGEIKVRLVLSNKAGAKVLDRARRLKVDHKVFNRQEFYNEGKVQKWLAGYKIDAIVLAGFLWLIPSELLKLYPDRIVNIHPALLPKYGGKGMYGPRVHEAIKSNGEKQTGISIHMVNEIYDDGRVIFQASCPVNPDKDSVEDIANKVHELEYAHYPAVIENWILTELKNK